MKLTPEQHREVCSLLRSEDRIHAQYRAGTMERDEAMPGLAKLHSRIDAIKGTTCRCLACRENRNA